VPTFFDFLNSNYYMCTSATFLCTTLIV